MARRNLPQLIQHIHRPGIHRNAQFADAGQRGGVNDISREDDIIRMVLRIISRRQRALNFTQRNGIHLYALLTHQAQNMNIRAGLLRKAHHIKLLQGRDLTANNLRVIDPYRAAEFRR